MALTLNLYNFSKRQNSTAIPSGDGVAVSVVLKNETSMNNPVFLLSGERPNYSYARFDGAYYFIDDIRSVRSGLYELICRLDPLGTYRTEIGATSAYVEYCTGGDVNIVDNRIAPKAPIRVLEGHYNIGILQSADHYNLTIVGQSSVDTVQVNKSILNDILNDVSNWVDNIIPTTTDIADAIVKGFRQLVSQGNAMDCIRSCRWIPWDIVQGSLVPIVLGNYQTNRIGMTVSTKVEVSFVQITIPFTRSGWLRLAPFTDVILYLPFVGQVNVTHPLLARSDQLNVKVSKDNQYGSIAYEITIGGVIIGTYSADCGVDIPIGISNIGAMSLANGITGAAIAASYGNYMAAIGAAVQAAQPTQSSVGGAQGAAGVGLSKDIYMYLLEHDPSGAVGNMDTIQGTPLFDTRVLSTLSGYVKTQGASVSGAIRGAVREQINSILDSGFFME